MVVLLGRFLLSLLLFSFGFPVLFKGVYLLERHFSPLRIGQCPAFLVSLWLVDLEEVSRFEEYPAGRLHNVSLFHPGQMADEWHGRGLVYIPTVKDFTVILDTWLVI